MSFFTQMTRLNTLKGLVIVLLILSYPFAEIYLLFLTAQKIGYFNTLLAVLLSAVIGFSILRNIGFRILIDSSHSLRQGKIPADAVLNGVQFVFAGLLFMIPGFLSDLLALIIVFPLTRKVVNILVKHYFLKKIQNGTFQFYGSTTWSEPGNMNAYEPYAREVKEAEVIDLETVKMQRLQGPKRDS